MAAYDVGFAEEEQRGKLSLKNWGKILKFSGKYWPLFIVLLLTMLVTAFYDSTFIPLMNAGLVNFFSQNPDIVSSGLSLAEKFTNAVIDINVLGITIPTLNYWQFIVVLGVGVLLRSVAIFVLFFSTNLLFITIMDNMRKECFHKIQELSFAYFDRTPSGWLIARLENDTSKIAEVISWGLLSILWPIAEWIFALITLFSLAPVYALFMLIPVPIILIIAIIYNYQVLKKNRLARTTYSSFIRWLADCLSGMKTIKVLSIEKETIDSAEHISTEYRDRMFKVTKTHAIFAPLIFIIGSFTLLILIALYTGIGAGITDPNDAFFLEIANLVILIPLASRIVDPVIHISDALIEVMDAQTSVEKIVSLLSEKIGIQDSSEVVAKYGTVFNPRTEAYEEMQGKIEFKSVNFFYIEGKPVLHSVSFDIPKGKTVAIVGETGSGKTTIANLMCRFYEPQEGEILVDGIEYRERSLGWLRSNIGYVEQNPLIFSLSIRENIKYGKLDASDDDVLDAIRLVGLNETMARFPKGLDTVLVDKGSELSMGERQLISFARAVIRNPRIIILDEATSNIDTETEVIVQKSLRRILSDKTSLIIAHRLSTIVHADKIIVLKDGVILETGTHKQLLDLGGYYHHLYMNQFNESDIDRQIIMTEID